MQVTGIYPKIQIPLEDVFDLMYNICNNILVKGVNNNQPIDRKAEMRFLI